MVDSTVAVALATKLLELFPPTGEATLAFPLSGAAFSSEELDIFDRPGASAEDLIRRQHARAQFARVLNQVPRDSQRWDTTGDVLWTLYERILKGATTADSVLSVADQQRLAAAQSVLNAEQTVDGVTSQVYTPALTAYYRYHDAVDEAERVLIGERISVELSEDPVLRAQWDGYRHAELQAALDKAMQDWATLGHRAEIEAAQAVVASLSGRNPSVRNAELLARFNLCAEGSNLVSFDPTGVLTTFYSPSDMFAPRADGKPPPWPSVSLVGAEIAALVAKASPELIPAIGAEASQITSITFEYADVAIVRPWFDAGLFAERAWRLDDGSVVSDGGTPRQGSIPAYVTGMVVARKITVTRQRPTQGTKPLWDLGWIMSRADLLNVLLRTKTGGLDESVMMRSKRLPLDTSQFVLTKTRVNPSMTGQATTRLPPSSVVVAPPPIVGQLQPDLDFKHMAMRRRVDALNADDPRILLEPQPQVPPKVGPGQLYQPPRVAQEPSTTTPAAVDSVTEEISTDGVVVLAYRLRRIPFSPNPDPTLGWADAKPATSPPPASKDYPLPAGHVFGTKAGPSFHNGRANASDRVWVMELQTQLKKVAGISVVIDGIYGELTESAIKQFQQSQQLNPPDGVVGPFTWSALFAKP